MNKGFTIFKCSFNIIFFSLVCLNYIFTSISLWDVSPFRCFVFENIYLLLRPDATVSFFPFSTFVLVGVSISFALFRIRKYIYLPPTVTDHVFTIYIKLQTRINIMLILLHLLKYVNPNVYRLFAKYDTDNLHRGLQLRFRYLEVLYLLCIGKRSATRLEQVVTVLYTCHTLVLVPQLSHPCSHFAITVRKVWFEFPALSEFF